MLHPNISGPEVLFKTCTKFVDDDDDDDDTSWLYQSYGRSKFYIAWYAFSHNVQKYRTETERDLDRSAVSFVPEPDQTVT